MNYSYKYGAYDFHISHYDYADIAFLENKTFLAFILYFVN